MNIKFNRYRNILNKIEKDFYLEDTEFNEWIKNYFEHHKPRIISDLSLIEQYADIEKSKILDIGCLPCMLSYMLKNLGYTVVGIDISPERMHNFIEKYDLNVKKCDIEKENLPFDDNSFDIVVFNEVFEHLRINPIFALKEIYRVLKKDGVLILSTVNLYFSRKILRFLKGESFNDAYSEFAKIYELGHAGHIREYSAKEVKKFLEKTGFKVQDIIYKSYHKGNPLFKFVYIFYPQLLPYFIVIAKK